MLALLIAGSGGGFIACGNPDRSNVDQRTLDDGQRRDASVDATETGVNPSPDVTSIATGSDSSSAESTTSSASEPDKLQFSKIAVGRDHWCGITQPEQDLVCVQDSPRIELPGPIVDFDMSHDLAEFHHWCAVTRDGRVLCNHVQMAFTGSAQHVSVGFFNACASDSTHVECFLPEATGGFDDPPSIGGAIEVEMSSLCISRQPLHASCVNPQGDELLPPEGHYLDLVAIPNGACAAILAPPESISTPDAGAAVNAALQRTGVACFQKGIATLTPLSGMYTLLDADVNGDGCAFGSGESDTPQVHCWGSHANTVPAGIATPLQIAVSTTQVCILDQQGHVSCYASL